MTTFINDIIELKPNKDGFITEITFAGNNLVWLDVTAQDELQLYLAVKDIKKDITRVLINHTVIPRGSFLSLFSNKLISDKIIIIQTSKKAVAWYESKSAI